MFQVYEQDPEEKDADGEPASYFVGPPVFQNQLFAYLDLDAPTVEKKQEFSNLVLLFNELINHDVFSHDSYMSQLISRGDLNNGGMGPDSAANDKDQKDENADGSFEDSKINDDLTNLLKEIKEGNQLGGNDNNAFNPPSSSQGSSSGQQQQGGSSDKNNHDISKCSRHWQYCYHFPLPSDEASIHDCNQRYVLLYGAGKGKDETSKNVKKLSKDILKLFSKKFSIDVSEGGRVKKHSKNDFLFDTVVQKFQNLSFYDQHSVTHQCGQAVLEMLAAFSNGSANYLPVAEYVAFLLDLTGLARNIQVILDWGIQILKELPGVETQLQDRGSCLTRNYSTTLALYIIGVLRRYHSILILNPSDVTFVFEQLNKIASKPKFPSESGDRDRRTVLDCNSAEWCIISFLYDLSNTCGAIIRTKDKFPELKKLFALQKEPSLSSCSLTDRKFGIDYIANPKKPIDPLTIKLLIESAQNQYNLVCNVLMEVCECNDTDKLNDIAILCCEFTAQCNTLSAEWLGALAAMCYAGDSVGYRDLLAQVSVADQTIYNRLGIFYCILSARQCFHVEAFVLRVAIPSLMRPWDELKVGPVLNESEIGARLSCHLLLKLFKSVDAIQPMFYSMGSPQPMPRPSTHASGIKYSCDRHLLSSAHRSITVGAIIAMLKMLKVLVLGDSESSDKSKSVQNLLGTNMDEDDFGLGMSTLSGGRIENSSLSEFAKHTMKQICSQEWVQDRCLQVPDALLKKGILIDPMLSAQQAQQLLRLICYPSSSADEADNADKKRNGGSGSDTNGLIQKEVITNIMNNLDEWNLRISALEIRLMFLQLSASEANSQEVSRWLDNAAHAIVEMFDLVDKDLENKSEKKPNSSSSSSSKTGETSSTDKYCDGKRKRYISVWMVPYLLKNLKLEKLQTRVLVVAGNVLDNGNWSRGSKTKSYSQKEKTIGHQPFLHLILTCIKELDVDCKVIETNVMMFEVCIKEYSR